MSGAPRIQVILASTREGRFGEKAAAWAMDRLSRRSDLEAELVVTPEYNHGYPAVLKNALDQVFPELNRKPIAFVGYGNSGGARSIEQLRLVSVELEMAPLRHAVHILPAVMVPAIQAEDPFDIELLASLDDRLDTAATDLVWWADALARARAG